MRADLERKSQEDKLDWIRRLHDLVLQSGSTAEADMEVVTILLNNIPALLTEIKTLKDVAERNSSEAEAPSALVSATDLLKAALPLRPEETFMIWIDPSESSVTTIQEFLSALSRLHRNFGGKGLEFHMEPERNRGRQIALKVSSLS